MRLFARIRNLYRQRQQWTWLIKDERKNKYHPSWSQRLRAWRKGYLSQHYIWYGLDRHDDTDFVSDRIRYIRTPGLNGPYRVLLDDKLMFREVFRRHEDLMPEAYALVRQGRVLSLSRDEPIGSVDDIVRLLARKRRLVVKPITGGGGANVVFLEHRDGGVAINGEVRDLDAARKQIARLRNHLLVEFVEQAAYSREIFPGSVNTLRILTLIDDDDPQPYMACANHRFGTRHTKGVDNISQGGLAALMDLETGVLGPGLRADRNGRPEPVDRHPDTGTPIAGVTVPRWRETVDRIVALAREYPYLPYVGWDVVMTEDGFRILEGNSFTGLEIFQLHKPMLADPRVRRFYKRRGVIQ